MFGRQWQKNQVVLLYIYAIYIYIFFSIFDLAIMYYKENFITFFSILHEVMPITMLTYFL